MKTFKQYGILLESLGVELNPPASEQDLEIARLQGMPEFLSTMYLEFDGMADGDYDPRNHLHIGSIKECREDEKEAFRNIKKHDHLFLIGDVLVYSFHISVDKHKKHGVLYDHDGSFEQEFEEFNDFFERLFIGEYLDLFTR